MKRSPDIRITARHARHRVSRLPLTAASATRFPRGVVLIVVLVLVVMVALAGFGFLAAMSTEYDAARLQGNQLQAQQGLASAESVLHWFGGLSARDRRAMGGWHHNPVLFRGRAVPELSAIRENSIANPAAGTVTGQSLNPSIPDDQWRFSVVSLTTTPERGAVLRFGLQSESDKVHLASLLRWDQELPGHGRNALRQLPGMTDAVADAILDWIDADDEPREFGAESEYYQTLDRPYRTANRLPGSLTELLYVRGVTRQALLGIENTDPQSNGDDTFVSGDSADTNIARDPMAARFGWSHFLTVHAAEGNRTQRGQPRVQLNSGSLTELEQQLRTLLPADVVRYVLLARVYGTTQVPVSGIDAVAAPLALSMSPAFRINSHADLLDSSVQIPAPSGPLIVQSPLQSDRPDIAVLFNRLLDVTTVHSEPVIHGRINICTASETVLRMIPGLTSEQAARLVSQRDTLESTADSLGWLLTDNTLETPTFRRLFPEITAGGDVFQGEIIVYRAMGGPVLRRNLILDAASSPVRRVYWTELTETSLPYPLSFLLSPRL